MLENNFLNKKQYFMNLDRNIKDIEIIKVFLVIVGVVVYKK